MHLKSVAECSKGSILQYFRPFVKLPFVIKTFVLSIFEWPLKTGFTVYWRPINRFFNRQCRLRLQHLIIAKIKPSSSIEVQYNLEIEICDLYQCAMDCPNLFVYNLNRIFFIQRCVKTIFLSCFQNSQGNSGWKQLYSSKIPISSHDRYVIT